jgi:peptide/nickel transport system substrate-binding protein
MLARALTLLLGLGIALAAVAAPATAAQTLTVLLPSEFSNLDPVEILSGDQTMVMYHVYCRLYTFNDQMEPVPDLVVQENLSPDQKIWTLKLRRGVKFHDGTPVTAEAVKYTIERMRKKGGSQRVLFQAITDISTDGEDTIVLTTGKPFPSLRNSLAHPNAGLVSEKADRELADRYAVQPVSCGPYAFKEWIRGARIVVTRNAGYYGPRPTYDTIRFDFVSEVTTRLFMIQKGSADIALRLGPAEAKQIEGSKKTRLLRVEGRNVFYQLNLALPPTNDLRVRQAINHAVDKNAIIQKVLQGAGSPARSVLEAMLWGHQVIGTWTYNPDKARQLLKEAGADRARVVLMSPENRYLLDSQVSQAVAGYLKAVGLNVDLKVLGDWAGYIDAIKKKEFNLYMLGWGGSTGDPDQVLQSLFHSRRAGNLWNLGAYANKEVDSLIDAGSATFDEAKRKKIYADAQKRLFEDAPWLFMYRVTSFTAVSDRVKEIHTLQGPEFHYVFPIPR